MKSNLSITLGGRESCVRFVSAKKHLEEGDELNTLAANVVVQVIKQNKIVKSITNHDSSL